MEIKYTVTVQYTLTCSPEVYETRLREIADFIELLKLTPPILNDKARVSVVEAHLDT